MTSVGPSAMEVEAPRETPMLRPARSRGTQGKKIPLSANFFKLTLAGLQAIYQYDVEMLVERKDKARGGKNNDAQGNATEEDAAQRQPPSINRTIFNRWVRQQCPNIHAAYDGRKIAYSAVGFPSSVLGKPCVLKCDREGVAPEANADARADEVRVVVRHTATLDPRELASGNVNAPGVQPVINALDVALSEGNSRRFVEVGRTFFSSNGARDLTGGTQAWRGFYQSIRMTQSGLTVNVDESFTPFWANGSLLDLCKSANGGRLPLNDFQWKKLGKDLHSVRVKARHTNISYRVFGFSPNGADRCFFKDNTTNENVSVADYVFKQYGVQLQQPNLPCVKTSPKRDILVPLELLDVCANQRRAKAMTPQQTTAMIKTAALKPRDRKICASTSIATAKYNEDETCSAFGMTVNPRMETVEARVLNPPKLQYRSGRRDQQGRQLLQSVSPRNGAWNMANNQVFKGCMIHHWVVIQVGRCMRRNELDDFIQKMVHIGTDNGLLFNGSRPNVIDQVREDRFENVLRNAIVEGNNTASRAQGPPNQRLQLVVIIKEKQDTFVYNTAKRICDLEMGVASQVLLAKKIQAQRGRPEQYIANVMLKINAKLGGCNVNVERYPMDAFNPAFSKLPHIVLGADVTHPAPGGGNRPSVAALVGSRDKEGMQYSGAIRNQASRQEIIQDMGSMFLEVYKQWFLNFNPRIHARAIIMFRDGVSEGQYQQVMDHEVPAIRAAAKSVYANHPPPKITYIIVTKRHHARFFGSDRTDARNDLDRNGNVIAGTVVDSGVTSKNLWDFYMNTHAGIQGTNRPSKYTVLLDECNMSADQLQAYVFRLSHSYARCTRSVSMVNSAYYAHLLAFRGRIFLGDDGSDNASEMSTGSSAVIPPTEKVHPNLGNTLYFI